MPHMAETTSDETNPTTRTQALTASNHNPSVTLASFTFPDGTTLNCSADDIIVFVGPNNAGKSAVLRELHDIFSGTHQPVVLTDSALRKDGTKESFRDFVQTNARIRRSGQAWQMSGYHWRISMRTINLEQYWPDQLTSFGSMFCLTMPTETRITGSDPVDSINLDEDALSHPIHILLDDDDLELRISKYFRQAFNDDLMIDRNTGRTVSLLAGTRPIPDSSIGEDRLSKTYREKMTDQSIPLNRQGDGMRSFASVILHLLAPITASVLILDEPEAFLHPPQARLLGQVIATEKSQRSQLFVATHSPDVLQGLISVAPDRLRLLRIQREGTVNHIKELDRSFIRQISSDALMNYSSVLSGVFHERVIICESDSDCMFYHSMLNLPGVRGQSQPDVLFVHASGKNRMAALADTLTHLGVTVDIIADIDIIREEHDLESIVGALNGNWPKIRSHAAAVRTAVADMAPTLNSSQIKKEIDSAFHSSRTASESVERFCSRIRSILRLSSPWDAVKQSGESAIPPGQATQHFQQLEALCQEVRLWIVPVGEMEGFYRSIGGHGPAWVQEVIEKCDLANDVGLSEARRFVRDIWQTRDK